MNSENNSIRKLSDDSILVKKRDLIINCTKHDREIRCVGSSKTMKKTPYSFTFYVSEDDWVRYTRIYHIGENIIKVPSLAFRYRGIYKRLLRKINHLLSLEEYDYFYDLLDFVDIHRTIRANYKRILRDFYRSIKKLDDIGVLFR